METIKQPKENKYNLYKIIRYTISALVILALAYWVLHDIDYLKTYSIIKKANIEQLFLVPVGYGIVCIFRSLRLYGLKEFSAIEPVKLFGIVSIHSFWNNVLPARSGEMTFLYLAKKHFGMEIGRSAGILTVIRLYDFLMTVIVFFCALLFFRSGNNHSKIFLLVGIVIMAMSFVIWQLPKITQIILVMTRKCDFFPIIMEKVNRSLGHFYESVISTKSFKVRLLLMLSTLPCNLSSIFVFHMVLISLGIHVSVIETTVGSTFALFSVMLPFNAPGNTGLLDAGWIVGFLFVGLDKSKAVASAVVMHSMLLVSAVIVGIVGSVLLKISRR